MAGETDILKQSFREQFPEARTPRIFRAPGRVNLIGEHTDYNFGFVLPIALDLACFTAAAASTSEKLRVFSRNVNERREWPISDIGGLKPTGEWTDYVIGVAQQLLQLGYDIRPLDVAIYGTVPVGSGLSSSAAIEVSSAQALLWGRPIDTVELACLAQRAEREFAGVPCGIMDQYVSVHGESGKAIEIDCRTITHRTVSLPRSAAIIAVNSMVKHDLSSSAYTARVRECAEAVHALQRIHPEVQSLRDVKSSELPPMPDIPFRRARHVTTENERVEAFVAAAGEGDLAEMGRLFVASHRSLQHDYEVSCEELDFLVDTAVATPGVYGARMTGGGFGGCTVNLVDANHAASFASALVTAYQARYDIEPQIIRCIPAAGAGEITDAGEITE